MKTITINRGLETRRSTSGKVRRTIRIDAEPMTINIDAKALGQPVANAIAHHFRESVRKISQQASPATIKMRQAAAKAFARGEAWALKRYGGGRMGSLPPNQSDKLFNDSGRFADGIVASAGNDNAWRINVAANRLNDEAADRIWNKLVSLIPEFANLSLLFDGSLLRRTIENLSKERIKIGKVAATQFQAFTSQLFGA